MRSVPSDDYRERSEHDVSLPPDNAVNDPCDLGFDFATVVETGEGR